MYEEQGVKEDLLREVGRPCGEGKRTFMSVGCSRNGMMVLEGIAGGSGDGDGY